MSNHNVIAAMAMPCPGYSSSLHCGLITPFERGESSGAHDITTFPAPSIHPLFRLCWCRTTECRTLVRRRAALPRLRDAATDGRLVRLVVRLLPLEDLTNIALRLEAIAVRLETIATRLEAIASRLGAIATRLDAIASRWVWII